MQKPFHHSAAPLPAWGSGGVAIQAYRPLRQGKDFGHPTLQPGAVAVVQRVYSLISPTL